MKLNFPIEQEEAGTDIRLMENFFKKASEDLGSTRDENISKSVSLEEEWSESSTSLENIDILNLTEVVGSLFRTAENDDFEDGMDSYFSIGLQSIICSYGNLALIIVSQLILDEKVSIKVASETLRQLGKLEHAHTYWNRLRILERCLDSKSSYIRDSAGLGISFMDEPVSIPAIKEAIKRETNPELKEDLKLVLDQLENNL